MAKKELKGKKDDEKLFAFLCYLISVIGVVLVLATKNERKEFSIYHAKQGMALFIAEMVVSVVVWILAFIPVIGRMAGWVLWIMILALWIVGMMNALNGKKVPLPIIGQFGGKFNF
jgi:uncharacterized membrane protein